MLNIDFSDINTIDDIKVIDSDYANELSKIRFDTETIYYQTGKFAGRIKQTDILNPMAFDTESSSGYLFADGRVRPFGKRFYNAHKNPVFHPITGEETGEYICPEYTKARKVAIQYLWQFAIKFRLAVSSTKSITCVFIGRTIEEFEEFTEALINRIRNFLPKRTSKKIVLYPYIHNFAFDFQYLLNSYLISRHITENSDYNPENHAKTFAREARKPMKASAEFKERGDKTVILEFRDSYVLTQLSLKEWCKNEHLPVSKIKLEGGYNRVRTPETDLSNNEIKYAVLDVVSMCYGLEKYIKEYGSFSDTPLTLTGTVRRHLKSKVLKNAEWVQACGDIAVKYSSDFDGYKVLVNKLFQGGYVHANANYVGETLYDILSFDFASSYPYVIATMFIPYTPFESIDVTDTKQVNTILTQDVIRPKYRYWTKIKVENLKAKKQNHILSVSKLDGEEFKKLSNSVVDNGRLVQTDGFLTLYLTDFDYNLLNMFYDYDSIIFEDIQISEARPFCKEYVEFVLESFQNKTQYKGVAGMEAIYAKSKKAINSLYGILVLKESSDIVAVIDSYVELTDDGEPIEHGIEWERFDYTPEMFYESQMKKIETGDCYTAFQFGCWVTCAAKYNLLRSVAELDKYVAYCDTDSMKTINHQRVIDYVAKYNKEVEALEVEVCKYYNLPSDAFTAKTPKGVVKRLGIFEMENTDCVGECYQQFKTFGCKRYFAIVEHKKDNKIAIETTVAGLPKSAGSRMVWKNGRGQASLDNIEDKQFFGPTESMKNTVYYNDDQPACEWTDYHGKKYYGYQRYGAAILPTSFFMAETDEFKIFLSLLENPDIYYDDWSLFKAKPKCMR